MTLQLSHVYKVRERSVMEQQSAKTTIQWMHLEVAFSCTEELKKFFQKNLPVQINPLSNDDDDVDVDVDVDGATHYCLINANSFDGNNNDSPWRIISKLQLPKSKKDFHQKGFSNSELLRKQKLLFMANDFVDLSSAKVWWCES